jgi:flagella basal body P-ring formation protein FlgA
MRGVTYMPPIFRRLVLLSAIAGTPAFAQSFENLERLDSLVSAALGAGIGEPGGASGPIDRRLRLAACPQPVEISEPAMGAIAVRCQPLGWRIRVPLTAGGQANAAPAPARASQRERAEPIVRRGDQIQLVALAAGFTVSMLAVADQDGAVGDRIRVRTERRTSPVIGQILPDGRVALPGFN